MSELERILNATAYLSRKKKYHKMQKAKRCLLTGGVMISVLMIIFAFI